MSSNGLVAVESSRPKWIRQRTIGRCNKRNMQASYDLVKRLKQEQCLVGHTGCVNCLEWNSNGDLLASGSDDHNVIIWNPFLGTKRHLVKTGHLGNIFSVKFIPATQDTIVATCASDTQVKLIDLNKGEQILQCDSCHKDRVKRLAVHANEPNLVWSAGEDGFVMQYDMRETHQCSGSKLGNLLIDLSNIKQTIKAKCIAVNPLRSEMLAVGGDDIYNRLFDRRYLKLDASKACTAYFAPGHLLKTNNRANNIQSYGTTYLAFNSTGSELLASVHAEQVYLFNTYEPWERYQSFETSLKPLLYDKEPKFTPLSVGQYQIRPSAHLLKLRQLCPTELPDDYKLLCNNTVQNSEINSNDTIAINVMNRLNELIEKIQNCPDLYRARAIALNQRSWRGDHYQALRDCCSALALQPLDPSTIYCLSTCLIKLRDRDSSCNLLEFIQMVEQEFKFNSTILAKAKEDLVTFMRSPSPIRGLRFDDNCDTTSSTLSSNSNSLLRMLYNINNTSDCNKMEQMFELEKSNRLKCAIPFDFTKRYSGHCNMNTDIKEASFFGGNDEFIVGGSDDGAFYIWDKCTTNIVKAVYADNQILNCVQPHPSICMLATSGIESNVKLWSSSGQTCRDVKALESRCLQNQRFIASDPLEAMIMMMYPEHDN